MSEIFSYVAIISIGLIVSGLALASTFYLYKYLRKKFSGHSYKYFAFIPTVLLIYFGWITIFPKEIFYKNIYKEITHLQFPPNSKFTFKTVSFPHHFGQYTSVFMFETSQAETEKLKTQIEQLGFDRIQNDDSDISESDKEIQNIKAKISQQYTRDLPGKKKYYVGLFDDERTVLIKKISW